MLYFNIKKEYEGFSLECEFSVKDGEILCILGKSGSGKTTLLNVLSGVESEAEGIVKSNETVFLNSETKEFIPIHKRKIGYIEQKPNLFPHLTVRENIFYGIKKKPYTKAQLDRFEYLLDAFSLKGQEDKMPNELSGGQQQRASIMRAIMYEPSLLLLDEPFSALDTNLRLGLRKLVLKLRDELKIPMIFVTHDLEEGYFICDKTIIIEDGKVIARGKKKEVFTSPTNLKQAIFVGFSNIFKARASRENNQLSFCNLTIPLGDRELDGEVYASIRDTAFSLKERENDCSLEVVILEINSFIDKKEIRAKILLDGSSEGEDSFLNFTIKSSKELAVGDKIKVYFKSSDVCAFYE